MTFKGYKQSEEHRLKIAKSHEGKKQTKETKLKISFAKIGNKNPAKRLEVKEKIRQTMKGKHQSPNNEFKKGQNAGEKSHAWKGDDIGYRALHYWINRHKSKSLLCENCKNGQRKLEAANISGQYKRDVNDFKWLCHRCHVIEDKNNPKNPKLAWIKRGGRIPWNKGMKGK